MSQNTQSLATTSGRFSEVQLKSANKHIFRALLSIASAALLIRVMGLVNQVIVSARFGAGAAMDAYFVAILLPIMIAQLAVGASENSFLPAYARIRARGTREQASILFSTLLNLLLFGGAVLTLLMYIFRRQVIFFSAPALDPASAGLATDLVPFILPVLLLMMVIGFLECVFNTEGQFGWPAYAGMLVPITTAALVLLVGKSQGVVVLCIGMVIGLCLQLGVFIIRARRAKLVYRPIIYWRNPEISLVFIAAWPALLGSVISQASPLIDQMFASTLATGSISALNYSLKLIGIPASVIALSVGKAVVPYLSRQAAMKDMKAFKGTLRLYLWAIGIGILMLSILMFVLANPLVQLFFQRGHFTSENTNHTATTLMGFIVGLTPMALVFIIVRAFSALGKTRVLMFIGIFNVFANLILDYIFSRLWQSEGIALATSVMYFCALLILLFTLRHMIGKLDLFSPPPEMVQFIQKLIRRDYYPYRLEVTFSSYGIPYRLRHSLRRQIMRMSCLIAVFAAGIIGVFWNYTYALRLAFGSIIFLAFLRYRYALLLAWVLIAVLIGSPFPIFDGNNLASGLTIPTLILMVLMPLRQTFKRMPALAFLLMYVLWVFTSIGISAIGISTFLARCITYLDFVAVGVFTINLLTTERYLMRLIDAILLTSTFVALYGIYGYLTKQDGGAASEGVFRIFSVFGSSPALGLFLSIVIPLSLYRALPLRGFKRIGGILVILALLTALVLTFARTALISVTLSILIMILFLPSLKMRVGLFSSFVAVALVVLLLATIGHIPLFERFFQSDYSTLNGRTDVWHLLLDRFDPTRLLGNGLNASGILLASFGVNGIRGVSISSYEAHNLFVATLYDHGIIGVSLLILVFISLFIGLLEGIRRTTGAHRMMFLTSFAIYIGVFLQSFEAIDILSLGIGIYFWVIMALPFALCWSAPQRLAGSRKEILDNDQERMPRMQEIQQTEQVSVV